jgi:EAL domain-containing protein (putative c-di-GMP-specific phosphodiesterase class I)
MFYVPQSQDQATDRIRRGFPYFQIVLQPIVDLDSETVYGYEALCRGKRGENYTALISDMAPCLIPAFDRLAMARALRLAARFRLEAKGVKIAINLGPLTDTLGRDAACVMRLAKHYRLGAASIMLELSEDIRTHGDSYAQIIGKHRAGGVTVAIDDFGAGYAGLNALATCVPDVVKIDRKLIQGIECNSAKKTIVGALSKVCRKLGVMLIAEGVETNLEYEILRGFGIRFMQGFLFARPTACEMSRVWFPGKKTKHFPRITRGDRVWLRNALRQ